MHQCTSEESVCIRKISCSHLVTPTLAHSYANRSSAAHHYTAYTYNDGHYIRLVIISGWVHQLMGHCDRHQGALGEGHWVTGTKGHVWLARSTRGFRLELVTGSLHHSACTADEWLRTQCTLLVSRFSSLHQSGRLCSVIIDQTALQLAGQSAVCDSTQQGHDIHRYLESSQHIEPHAEATSKQSTSS